MKWTELIDRVAARAGVPKTTSRAVIEAFVDECVEALGRGEDVIVRELVAISSRWREPATVRSIGDARKIRLDGRYVARFRPARRLRAALAARTPQTWRDASHQAAWRVAEALVGDLALYHSDKAPPDLAAEMALDAVDGACASRFGPLWARVRQTYETRVPSEVRQHTDYVAIAARARWSPAAARP